MATGMGSGGRTIGAPEEMMMLTNEQIAAFGIVTREAKGDELTHEELDRNLLTMIDVAMFSSTYDSSLLEYPAIKQAVTLDPSVGSVTVNSLYGFGAVELPDELVGSTITWDNGYGAVYAANTMTDGGYLHVHSSGYDGSSGVSIPANAKYLVIEFDGSGATSATVTVQTDTSEEGQ